MYVRSIWQFNMNIKRVQILTILGEAWACASCSFWLISPLKRCATPGVGQSMERGIPLRYIPPETDDVLGFLDTLSFFRILLSPCFRNNIFFLNLSTPCSTPKYP